MRELRKIDPELRVVWGYQRYLKSRWAIERKLSPERYWSMYGSLFDSGEKRFIQQPIFDDSRPIWDEHGDIIGSECVGHREFDLAPEHEWVMFVENGDGSFRQLDPRTLTALRRAYAWDRFHSLTRAKIEREAEQQERLAKQRAANVDACLEEIKDHRRELLDLPLV